MNYEGFAIFFFNSGHSNVTISAGNSLLFAEHFKVCTSTLY